MLRCQCPSVCPSVRDRSALAHPRIIANLGFKFRSNFLRIAVAVHSGMMEEIITGN